MTQIDLPTPTEEAVLGAQLSGDGATFGLWAPRATRVELALVDEDRTQHNQDMELGEDGVWRLHVPGVAAEQRYGFRVHGEWAPEDGRRFNPAKLLLDPYARAITGGVDYAGPISDHTTESDFTPDPTDSFEAVPLSVVVEDTPPPEPIAQRRPLAESVIYETHVKGYTQLHPQVPEHLRGTFAGLAYPAVIEHLQDLGVTAIELLPVHHFVSEPFLIGRGLTNFWGYNTLGFFAPHAFYCSVGTMGQQVREFKEMVTAFHQAGIEVILDVVFNHTGEGGHEGPTLCFRGIDHAGYYRLTHDQRNDYDVTGTGNSVDTSNPGVVRMIMDSLRYWVTEMGVDGFRFDLATTLLRDGQHNVTQDHPLKTAIAEDPILADIKMIAEPWDVGPYGYQVGRFGPRWSEWNDRFRGLVRDYWRGNADVQELAARLVGSPDLFDHDGRSAASSINFVTAHDGFTLRDLVTYDLKHNQANGEGNRDGSDDNRSWNCGFEGETADEGVNALRHRQAKNLLITTVLAAGVPMITAADEIGRTQGGNNNAYCQDGPISWVNWGDAEAWSDLRDVTRTVLRLRRDHPVLRSDKFRHGDDVIGADGKPTGRKDLAWFAGYPHDLQGEMTVNEWQDQSRRTLGMYIADNASDRATEADPAAADDALLIWFHAGTDPVEVQLPGGPWGKSYKVLAHTGAEGELPEESVPGDSLLTIPGRTIVILQPEA